MFDALRNNESVLANELAAIALSEKGFNETDQQVRRDFVNRFHHMLYYMGRRGHAMRIFRREGSRWKLAPRERDLLDEHKQ